MEKSQGQVDFYTYVNSSDFGNGVYGPLVSVGAHAMVPHLHSI